MISLIAAIGKNGELGQNNHLIWSLKEDLKYFKETTQNHTVIMGYNTYKSIGKPLPNRVNIILTKNNKDKINDANVIVYDDMEKLLKNLQKDEEYFVIGGAPIYQAFYNLADKMYLTLINAECQSADSYFPKIENNKWRKTIVKHLIENDITYDIVLFERIK